ncbi:MAG TPA: Maf family protein [Bdellovibrionales bacterium]|nr:Maf family protein [Bdellovibrionales bacterium]
MRPRLVLASQSPRRRELLAKAGFEFTHTSLQISEIPDENLNLPDQVRGLASDKADAWLDTVKPSEREGILLLTADTVVILDGKILGKPKDQKENREFLERLSGHFHEVITAVCLVEGSTGKKIVAHETSTIYFRKLNAIEVEAYVTSGDGLDKAGGYGIQGEAGKFVEKLEGPFDNVMGLPVELIEQLLRENGWEVARKPK